MKYLTTILNRLNSYQGIIYILLLFMLSAQSIYAQCDTMPIATRWDFPRYDSFNVRDQNGDFYFERLGLEGTHLDFTTASAENPAVFSIQGYNPHPSGNGGSMSIIAYPDGSPRIYFNGKYLIDGQSKQILADYTDFGYGLNLNNLNNGLKQHLILQDPVNDDIIHIFMSLYIGGYGPGQNPYQFDIPAYYSRYDIQTDSVLILDSILHNRATEGWNAIRHPDGESWWVSTRVHSPSGIRSYKLTSSGIEPAIFSPGGPETAGGGRSEKSTFNFSPDGTKIAFAVDDSLTWNDFVPIIPFDSILTGGIYVADFDCNSGLCSNFVCIDSMIQTHDLIFSKSGQYIYANQSRGYIFPGSDSLYRYKLPSPDENHYQREYVPNGFAAYALTRGPDSRIYTGSHRLGVVHHPERWIDSDDRSDGMRFDTLFGGPWFGPQYITKFPVSLPELRTPSLRGDNIVQCGDTLNYRLVDNCYQELALVSTTPGPGIEMTRTGSELLLSFDTATTFPQVRYLAMANNHTCRTYRDTFWIYVEGCESNCTPILSSDQLTSCDSVLVHGQWQFVSDDYTQTFQNLQGCDSTSTIQLTINNSIRTTSSLTACDSALVHGNWVTTSGEYPASLSTVQGCDSTSVVTVSISSELFTSEQLSACDSAFVAGQWQYSSGDFTETFQSIQGCDSTHTVQLSIGLSVRTNNIINACDSAFIHQEWVNASGTYPQTFSNVQGCDSTSMIELVITPTPPPIQLPTDTTLPAQAGFSLNIDSLATFAFDWQPPTAVDCADCSIVEVMAGFAGRLTVEIGEAPCTQTTSLLFNRENKEASTFATPTAFSPNGDDNNDFFEIALSPNVELLELAIYDRWGSMVYQGACPCTRNANGLIETWDGNYQGKPANPAVFAWIARVRNAQGEERLEKGDVTLVR